MTIAILRDNGDIIWFDAVTHYSEKYAGSVTAHPIENGSKISDHTTTNNLMLTIQGVISDADFNIDRPIILESDAQLYGISNKQFVNNSPIPDNPVVIKSTPGVFPYLPETVAQFVTPPKPIVIVADSTKVKVVDKIKEELMQIAGGIVGLSSEQFSLIEFKDDRLHRVISPCVMTSLTFTETPTSGDALYPNMTIERVRYATTLNTTIPKTANKGKRSGKTTARPEVAGDTPATAPTNNSGSKLQGLFSSGQKAVDMSTQAKSVNGG